MTLPNLCLIAAPKAGTTTVAGWLSEHPDVYCSVSNEPYYWASDYPRMRAHYGFDSRSAYEAHYSSGQAWGARYRGDGSTAYLSSDRAIPDICATVPALESSVRRLRQWSRTIGAPGVAALKRSRWRRESRPVALTRERRRVADLFKADTDILSGILDA